MVTALYGAFAAALLLASVFAARARSWLLALVCLAVVYDNVVIALGTPLGEGTLLRSLNTGRFAAHALCTPLLIPVAVQLADRYGVRWASRTRAKQAATVLTIVAIALGTWTEVVAAELEPRTYAGALRYVDAAAAGPPIPAVVTMLVLVVAGASIWRRASWPWLFVGAVAMFAAAAGGVSTPWLGNLGEVFLLSTLAWTAARVARDAPARVPVP
ncbi:hypothetical protein KZZ52_47085 [Dactylosporangium sp. AC04546]|uniref:hypothetical protein n=1 Tax=Dactylosporangium sp. AC04546 TaxID=2862460 RepID=UPI001EE10071|nr:hypothetical protein [Dactylosporangium sp. AC04546]WVK81480.1 hypothetical protein KZZ52_47085 [Dactylosporangium sp. AC04546]